MQKQEVLINAFILTLFLFGTILLVVLVKPSITGLAVYEEQTPNVLADINYDSNLISSENNEFKLIPAVTSIVNTVFQRYNITLAEYNSEDKLEKVIKIDEKQLTITKNNLLNMGFEDSLNNGDIIAFYLKKEDPQEVFLCGYNQGCNFSNYGSFSFEGSKDFYNLTISNLEEPKSLFSINYTKLKIDYIEAIHFINEETITTTYPNLGTIETTDISPENLSSWNFIAISDAPQNQTINYYYSIDSGENWISLIDYNLSSINLSKLKFKIELLSDSVDTPILYGINLSYFIEIANQTEETNVSEGNITEEQNQTEIPQITTATSSGGGSSGHHNSEAISGVIIPIVESSTPLVEPLPRPKETGVIAETKTESLAEETPEPRTMIDYARDRLTGFMAYGIDKIKPYSKYGLVIFIICLLAGIYSIEKIKKYRNANRNNSV